MFAEDSSDIDIEVIDDDDTDDESIYAMLQERIAKRQKLEVSHRSHLNLLAEETQHLQSSHDKQIVTVNQRREAVAGKQSQVEDSQRTVQRLQADLNATLTDLHTKQEELVALQFQLEEEKTMLEDIQANATQKRNEITQVQDRSSHTGERLNVYEKLQALLPRETE